MVWLIALFCFESAPVHKKSLISNVLLAVLLRACTCSFIALYARAPAYATSVIIGALLPFRLIRRQSWQMFVMLVLLGCLSVELSLNTSLRVVSNAPPLRKCFTLVK